MWIYFVSFTWSIEVEGRSMANGFLNGVMEVNKPALTNEDIQSMTAGFKKKAGEQYRNAEFVLLNLQFLGQKLIMDGTYRLPTIARS